MHYVILRDDDTCACTPPACLERLYRPFLESGMPVTLATIPEVRTDVRMPDGRLEGYLAAGSVPGVRLAPIGLNRKLVDYIRGEPGYRVAQHGCHHDLFEFGESNRGELARRLDRGTLLLLESGFARAPAFVAPYDRFSRAAFLEVAARFDVISAGWFEARRLPIRWWPSYAVKKMGRWPHWRAGGKYLLSHPGCLLSYQRPHGGMLESVRHAVEGASLTVLVVHWWEFFREGVPDEGLIGVLHEVAAWLSSRPDVRVVSF
ncbi:MAG TPA: hypothetical protein VII43_01725, partial [Opitutaceae bacterium]